MPSRKGAKLKEENESPLDEALDGEPQTNNTDITDPKE